MDPARRAQLVNLSSLVLQFAMRVSSATSGGGTATDAGLNRATAGSKLLLTAARGQADADPAAGAAATFDDHNLYSQDDIFVIDGIAGYSCHHHRNRRTRGGVACSCW